MDIKELLEPISLDYEERIGNLDVEASGVVKSKKYFPIFMIDGEEVVFKPLSKTKPLTTDFFSYAEVYWSYVIKKYFIPSTPLYRLAYIKGIEEKYYNKGTVVKKLGDKKFTNILEYFMEHKEDSFDISKYVNYCMKDYDYTCILESDFVKSNPKVGEDISLLVLLSILRMDQNFHYENVNMDVRDNGVAVVEPMDFEFSTPFMYPENVDARTYYIEKYLRNLRFPLEIETLLVKEIPDFQVGSTLFNNIYLIVKNYPHVVDKFLECLDSYYKDIDDIELDNDECYIGKCSSDYWMIGHAKYKDNDMDKYQELLGKIKKEEIDVNLIFKLIKEDNKIIVLRIKSMILGIRMLMENGYVKKEDMTMEHLAKLLGIELDNNYEELFSKVLLKK